MLNFSVGALRTPQLLPVDPRQPDRKGWALSCLPTKTNGIRHPASLRTNQKTDGRTDGPVLFVRPTTKHGTPPFAPPKARSAPLCFCENSMNTDNARPHSTQPHFAQITSRSEVRAPMPPLLAGRLAPRSRVRGGSELPRASDGIVTY